MLVLETLRALKGLTKMNDVWAKVGKFLGRAIALTVIVRLGHHYCIHTESALVYLV